MRIGAVLLLSAFTAIPSAGALDGVVLLVGDTPPPPHVSGSDALAVLEALDLRLTMPTQADARARALEQFRKARHTLYEAGNPASALPLARRGRAELPAADGLGTDRTDVLRGLWLLVHLLAVADGDHADEIAAVIAHAWRIDPRHAPPEREFSPTVRERWERHRADMAARSPRLLVNVAGGRTCTLVVDGLPRGAVDTPIQLAPGSHSVEARCGNGRSFVRTVAIDAAGDRVSIPRWELRTTVARGQLVVESTNTARVVEAVLLARTAAPWVLTVSGDDRDCWVRLAPREGTPRQAEISASRVAGWLGGDSVESQDRAGAKPWQWAMLGLGALVVGAGGLTHAMGAEAVADTEAGFADRRDEFAGFEAAYGTLYGVGGATMLTALILIIVDEATAD